MQAPSSDEQHHAVTHRDGRKWGGNDHELSSRGVFEEFLLLRAE